MIQSINLTEIKKIEVNGKPIEERTQEIFVSKNRKGKMKKRIKNTTTYFCPKNENKVPILDWQDHIGYYREKYKSDLFADLINKK